VLRMGLTVLKGLSWCAAGYSVEVSSVYNDRFLLSSSYSGMEIISHVKDDEWSSVLSYLTMGISITPIYAFVRAPIDHSDGEKHLSQPGYLPAYSWRIYPLDNALPSVRTYSVTQCYVSVYAQTAWPRGR
jgi:hypothetical protein